MVGLHHLRHPYHCSDPRSELYARAVKKAMALNYYRNTWCGSAAASLHNDEEIEACAIVVATLRRKRRWGGSVVGHQYKKRDRISGAIRLNNDYFVERPVYNPGEFCRRFHVQQSLMLEIEDKV